MFGVVHPLKQMIFLGIDCGTQSTKTIALDYQSGRVVASASQEYPLIAGLPPGHMEQHPSDWTDAAEKTILSVLQQLGARRSEVRGIGVSGQQHGLVVLDSEDQVVRPAKLWCDTSTVDQCDTITKHFGGTSTVIELVGNAMLPGYTAPKILWIRENEPSNWERVRSVLLPHDYLNFWLTGVKTMEYGDASGTALMDVREREWSQPMLDFIAPGLGSMLPPLQSSLAPAGTLRPKLCAAWGLESEVTVSAGGGDNMMGAIGTGNTAPGCVTASLGTSGTLFACSDQAAIDPAGEVAGFCDSADQWLPLVCTMNVTLVTELARGMFGWSHGDYDSAIAGTPAGANGLLLLPYLVGERTPNLPHGTGVLHGLTVTNMTAPHIARACMEGVTLGLGYGLNRLRELGIATTEIRLTGGGSHSPAWRQIAADIFEVPVVCLKTGEGAALGAAVQSAWASNAAGPGDHASFHDFTSRFVVLDEATRATPEKNHAPVYREMLARMQALRSCLKHGELL
jgi:xylulokinase